VSPGPLSLDDSYRRLLRELPAEARRGARALPATTGFRLGVVSWDACVHLDVCRDLPVFAAQAIGKLRPSLLSRFVVAHHRSLFYGVLADRLADGQIQPTIELQALERSLLAAWRRSLAAAIGNTAAATAIIAERSRLVSVAQKLQRRIFARPRLDLGLYRRLVLRKLSWTTLTAEALLALLADRSQQRVFAQTMQLVLLGLQCADDALDVTEDDRTLGNNIPALLDSSPQVLAAASAHLMSAAAELAHTGAFHRLADWLGQRAEVRLGSPGTGDRFGTELQGMILAAKLRTLCEMQTLAGHRWRLRQCERARTVCKTAWTGLRASTSRRLVAIA